MSYPLIFCIDHIFSKNQSSDNRFRILGLWVAFTWLISSCPVFASIPATALPDTLPANKVLLSSCQNLSFTNFVPNQAPYTVTVDGSIRERYTIDTVWTATASDGTTAILSTVQTNDNNNTNFDTTGTDANIFFVDFADTENNNENSPKLVIEEGEVGDSWDLQIKYSRPIGNARLLVGDVDNQQTPNAQFRDLISVEGFLESTSVAPSNAYAGSTLQKQLNGNSYVFQDVIDDPNFRSGRIGEEQITNRGVVDYEDTYVDTLQINYGVGASLAGVGTQGVFMASGMSAGCKISGNVFEDSSGNDLFESGETLLDNVSVSIYLDDGDGSFETNGSDILVETQDTNSGQYEFTNLAENQDYWIEIDPTDSDLNSHSYGGGNRDTSQVNPRQVSLGTANINNINFPFDALLSDSCPASSGSNYQPLDFSNFALENGNNVGRYSNIGQTVDGTVLDMIVTVTGDPFDRFGNLTGGTTANGDAVIRVLKDAGNPVSTSLTWTAQFVNSSDDSPVVINGLLSLYDIDRNTKKTEQVTLSNSLYETIATSDSDDLGFAYEGSNTLIFGEDADGTDNDPRNAFEFTFINKSTIQLTLSSLINSGQSETGNAEFVIDGNLSNPSLINPDCNIDVTADYSDAPIDGTAPDGSSTVNYGNTTHEVVSGIQLGNNVDTETASLASSDASGDSTDDDGILFPTLISGETATITANVSGTGGYLQGWIDWNGDGSFDAGEQIAADVQDDNSNGNTAGDGTINLPITVPAGAITSANTFARFRWSTTQGLNTTDAASNGEVEDYQIAIAPATSALTSCPVGSVLTEQNVLNFENPTPEPGTTNGNYSVGSVYRFPNVATNTDALVEVVSLNNASVTDLDIGTFGLANAFQPEILSNFTNVGEYSVDFQIRFVETGTSNPIILNRILATGVDIDGDETVVREFARFTGNALDSFVIENPSRLTATQLDSTTVSFESTQVTNNPNINLNTANMGTVEYGDVTVFNYRAGMIIDGADPNIANQRLNSLYFDCVTYNNPSSTASVVALDYGDAPDTYGTDSTANNSGSDPVGASHRLAAGIHLGSIAPDSETDAATPLDGSGDGAEDDGINLPALIRDDTSYSIPASNITASGSGTIHAWVDFDNSGTFEPGEYNNVVVNNGTPSGDLSWSGITVGAAVNTYARFRFTSDTSINANTPSGEASNGEVEDYQVVIVDANPDYSQSCTTDTKIAIVLDGSGSIDTGGGVQDVRDGIIEFIDQIVVNAPGTQVGIVEFAATAKTAIPFTAVTTTTRTNDFLPYINDDYHEDESNLDIYTNWEAGLKQANDDLPSANAVIFVTDGNPNRYLDNSGNVRNDKTTAENIQEAVPWANAIKQRGTHIYGFGINNGVTQDNFKPITENSGDFEVFVRANNNADTADYSYVETFAEFGSELTFFTQSICNVAGKPSIALVKRITDLNPNPNNIDFNAVLDDVTDDNDNDPKWENNFLKGQISIEQVLPDEEVEYTVYFLSNGNLDANSFNLCDLVPDNMTFVENGYGNNTGIELFFQGTSSTLSNNPNDDPGEFRLPATNPPGSCKKVDPNDADSLIPTDDSDNKNGAIIVNFNETLPFSISPGDPSNGYGFIRFKAKIKN